MLSLFAWIGDVARFGGRALLRAFRSPFEIAEIARQIYEVGFRSLPLIAASGFAVGAVTSMHTRGSLARFFPLAVDSFKHLVTTRVIACMIALPLLTVVMNLMGIIGGFTAETVINHISFRNYFDQALSAIDFDDYIPATMKTILFGFIIASVSSYLGYFTRGGTAGVGQSSTRSVVFSSILVILSNVIVVKTIFFFFPGAAQ